MTKYFVKNYEELKKVLKGIGFEQIYEYIQGTTPNDEFKFGIWLSQSRILVVRSQTQNRIKFEFCDNLPKDLSEYDCITRLSDIKK